MIPLSLYIHIPWCVKKCPYCDFNSHTLRADLDEQAYVDTLLSDLRADIDFFSQALDGRKLRSIFIGGGTPSLFSANSIAAIINGVNQQIDFERNIEITLEANLGSAEMDKFIGFRQANVNRLSIGVQSFNTEHLKALGRVHSSTEALNAAAYARAAGFDNFNLDIMFGLPKQSHEQSLADIAQALKLNSTHLSCYQLTIEPNTLFHHNPPITPNDESLWEMQLNIQSLLAASGFKQYEVSAYANEQRQCEHNLNYWQFGDYLGIGAGAHGKVTQKNGEVWRNWKIKHPTTYLAKRELSSDESNYKQRFMGGLNQVKTGELPFEFMMNALRLSDGFTVDLFEQRSGQAISGINSQLDKHQKQGLISISDSHVSLTERGKVMLDSMLQDYLPQ